MCERKQIGTHGRDLRRHGDVLEKTIDHRAIQEDALGGMRGAYRRPTAIGQSF